MTPSPVRVAGAGVAGLTTAIGLARQGISVQVFDRAPDSGATHRSRFDAIENWTSSADFLTLLSGWGLNLDTSFHPISQIELYDFNGDCYPLDLPRPLFYGVKRGVEPDSLDQGLKTQALELGVQLHYGKALPREEVDVWAVGSQGRGYFLAVGLSFRTSHPDALKVIVDSHLAPKAYAYFFAIESQATLCVVLTKQFRQARSLLDEAVKTFQRIYPFEMCDPHPTAGLGGLVRAFAQPPAAPITVGEAAGLQDYLWGFGIRHALLSGTLAARAIAEGVDYQRLVAEESRPLVQSSLINRMFYERARNRVYRALIRRFSTTQDLNRLLYVCYRSRTIRRAFWRFARLQYER